MLPQITILDGGMGGELIRRGSASRTELWSARAFVKAGATLVGGCCGIGPEYIRALARATL